MDQRTDSRVRDWDARPFSGGYDGLRDLADGGFSGAVVTVGDTWLFMLNGRIIGLFQGRIEDFEAGDGTVYRAPDPSLPLLFAMEESGGEQQAKYYTNDTPISQAHQQLSDANFTGFIELSENVLSGDYYVVYYGGRSMSCAFVGASERLLTGDEAFQQADDEVGIYEVRSVDVEVVELPDPEPEPADSNSIGGAGSGGGAPASGESRGRDAGGAAGQAGEPAGRDAGRAAGRDDEPAGRDPEPAGRDMGRAPGQDAGGGDTAADAGRRDPAGERDAAGEREPADGQGSAGAAGQDPAGSETGRSANDGTRTEGSSRDGAAPGAADADRPDASRQQPGETGTEPRDDRQRRDGVPEHEPTGDPREPEREPDTGRDDRAGGRPAEEPEERPSEERTAEPDPGASEGEAPERAGRETADRTADTSTNTRASEPDQRGAGGSTGGADAGGTPERQDAGRTGTAASRGLAASAGGTASMQPEPKPPELFDETRRIPSLDPDRTGQDAVNDGASDSSGVSTTAAGTEPTGTTASAGTEPSSADRRSPEAATGGAVRTSESADDAGGGEAVDAAVADEAAGELRSKLADREERIEKLEANLADLRVQRDGLRDERDGLREEVEELEAEIVDLEAEIQTLRDRLNEGTEGRRRLDEEEALRGTNLFVRYDSKSGGTLEDVQAGDVDPEEVNENLRLEHHTQFEADNVAVDGRPFEEFLRDSIYRQYVGWLVQTLPYEIRDTGNVKQLRDLYDALPQVDRAELLGEVQVEYTEDGETYREPRQFDVVLRDRMGDPLLVADLNDSRNPASEDMMAGVVRNATEVGESHDSLAAAMLVTASFFEPGALETADEAAGGGGLMGGSSKASFVKLSRKRGYHLLLVETRDREFHVNVPEL
ncbi:MAG: hypothetical protein V5A23_00580 [Halobacteriales archaeon]